MPEMLVEEKTESVMSEIEAKIVLAKSRAQRNASRLHGHSQPMSLRGFPLRLLI